GRMRLRKNQEAVEIKKSFDPVKLDAAVNIKRLEFSKLTFRGRVAMIGRVAFAADIRFTSGFVGDRESTLAKLPVKGCSGNGTKQL
ncbi:hypothetical protein K0M31_000722, partial [Melipona bicolor]